MSETNIPARTNSPVNTDAKLRTLLQKMPGFVGILAGPDHIVEYANDAYTQFLGGRQLVGLKIKSAFSHSTNEAFFQALDKVYRSGEVFEARSMAVALEGDGHQRYVDVVCQPITDDHGAIEGVFVTGHEVTDHVEAVARAKRSEDELRTLADALPVLVSYIDIDERYQFNNKIYEDWFPKTREEIQGQTIRSIVGEKAYSAVRPQIERVLAGERFQFEQLMPYENAEPRYVHVEYVPREAKGGGMQGWYALVQDITKTKLLEQQREDLTRELAHRIRNTLTLVQSIVSQSMRHAETLDAAGAAIFSRISALGRAQDVFLEKHSVAADLETVVRAAIAPHCSTDQQFSIEGPAVAVEPSQTVALSLALHELATNAVKYGALSMESGTVAIGWQIGPKSEFTFTWSESGGPAVTTPTRVGFGSRLIERMVAPAFYGEAELRYETAGVQFELHGQLHAPDADV
ncbi:sensor histidine kinase [Agrobacterium sp. ES01]|uniref:sensor histidine kinase n=1 Tax=Agrobacterium sp. ES01 TaxID=3420714 RepID=UPI003D13FF85